MKNQTKTLVEDDIDVLDDEVAKLVLYNDDVTPFMLVVETLMQVCGHSSEQAEQCALIVHDTGSYAVKHGSYEDMVLMRDKFISRKITAEVE